MIEILLTREEETYILPVERVEWRGQKYQAPRTITVNMVNTSRGLHHSVSVNEGDAVTFLWKGTELFRGIIFSRDVQMDGTMSFTAYDHLYYLVNNTDSKVFSNVTASDILKRLCKAYQIEMGHIADTEYVKKNQVNEDDTLYDMVLMALDTTYKVEKTRYSIVSRKGKIELLKNKDNVQKWIIEKGVNLTSYSYSTSIEDMATRVKLTADDEETTVTVQADDKIKQDKYGVLQVTESVSEKLNKAQLKQRADQMLAEKSKVARTFSLEALGLSSVVSGVGIHVIVPELEIKKGYYVVEDTHTFDGNDYSMSLTLSETDDLPEIDEDLNMNGTSKDSNSDEAEDESTFAERLRQEIQE